MNNFSKNIVKTLNTSKKGIRINLGGKEYKDKRGEIWLADKAYVKGSWGCLNLPETDILTTSDPISGTSDIELFQTVRMGESIIYKFDLPNGKYEIKLFFAELYWETNDAEYQDTYIQGKKVFKDFNIFDEAGHDRALEKKAIIKVTQGYLKIDFIGCSLPMHSGARTCAIEIKTI